MRKVGHEYVNKRRGSLAMVSVFGGVLVIIALLGLVAADHSATVSMKSPSEWASASDLTGRRSGVTSTLEATLAEDRQLSVPLQLTPADDFTCILEITTTDRPPTGNHNFATAAPVANYPDQALVTGNPGDELLPQRDFYRLDNAIIGAQYTLQAKPDWTTNYNLGIVVYDRDRTPIITDTDTSNNFGSVTLVPDNFGPYYFEVFQITPLCTGHTYALIYNMTPPPTPTPLPDPTPTAEPPEREPECMTGYDQYEPNYNFELATTLAPGVSYRMNFVPWGCADYDNDFLRIRVKPGLQLTCETSDLDPGVDPRMALYSGPGEQYFVMANDDIEPGNFNSRVSYYANFEGFVYIVVGQGKRMHKRDTVNSEYTVTCNLTVPGRATPVPGQPPPPVKAPDATATPMPAPTATPPDSPIATPTPPPNNASALELSFRLVTRPAPVTPTPMADGFRTFRILIYFDADSDGQMGAGEGVAGFFVQVLSADGSQELAQGYTDEQGQLSFTVPTVGTVRVMVPLLGLDRLIDASRHELKIRIAPPTLPAAIP